MIAIARSAGKLALLLALVFCAPLLPGGNAAAQTGTYNPETPADPATEARLKALSLELRCLVCQNQTIADSNADLAVDLRRIVRSQILDGKSDREIKQYLVARYGDFVLYKPPVQGNTTLLWFGPFGLLLGGAGVWWLLSRKRSAARAGEALSADDEQKAKSLLDKG